MLSNSYGEDLEAMKDGWWWRASRTEEKVCPRCGVPHQESPDVMYYHTELDPLGEQRKMHSGWAEHDWLVWWQCDECGHDSFETVSTETVLAWIETLGPFRDGTYSESPLPYLPR